MRAATLQRLRTGLLTNVEDSATRRLRDELAQLREQGFAIVDQELELGLRSIAVPVRRPDGVVIAAIKTGVHAARADKDALRREFLPALEQAAVTITASVA